MWKQKVLLLLTVRYETTFFVMSKSSKLAFFHGFWFFYKMRFFSEKSIAVEVRESIWCVMFVLWKAWFVFISQCRVLKGAGSQSVVRCVSTYSIPLPQHTCVVFRVRYAAYYSSFVINLSGTGFDARQSCSAVCLPWVCSTFTLVY